MEQEVTEANFVHQSPKELVQLIDNYFCVRSELLSPPAQKIKRKRRTKIYYHLSFDELSQILKFLDLRSLISSRLVDRKWNISAAFAIRDNYDHFTADPQFAQISLELQISSAKMMFLKKLRNPNELLSKDYLPKRDSIQKLQLWNLLHNLSYTWADQFMLNPKKL